jgi:hypothetical protein
LFAALHAAANYAIQFITQLSTTQEAKMHGSKIMATMSCMDLVMNLDAKYAATLSESIQAIEKLVAHNGLSPQNLGTGLVLRFSAAKERAKKSLSAGTPEENVPKEKKDKKRKKKHDDDDDDDDDGTDDEGTKKKKKKKKKQKKKHSK